MRIKRNRKLMSILLTLSLLVAMLVPMVGPASAATTYSMSNVLTLNAGTIANIGTLSVSGDQAAFSGVAATTPSTVWLSAPSSPSGFGFGVQGAVYGTQWVHDLATGLDTFTLNSATYTPVNAGNVQNTLNTAAGAAVSLVANNSDLVATSGTTSYYKSFKVVVSATNPNGAAAQLFLPLALDVPSGASGAVNINAVAPSSSGFSSGSVTVANVGTGTVALAVEDTSTVSGTNSDVSGVISIKESSKGGITANAMKLTLPPGFTWKGATAQSFMTYWGVPSSAPAGTQLTADDFNWATSNAGRELDITPKTSAANAANLMNISGTTFQNFLAPVYFKFTFGISVDDSIAKQGDINVSCSGDNLTTGSINIGSYGTYSATIKANGDPANITAGKAGVKLGQFEVDEGIKNSLIDQRTITLTLPAGTIWDQNNLPTVDASNSTMYGISSNFSWTAVGTDGREIKGTFGVPAGGSSDAAKIIFKNAEVETAVDFSGDVDVTVGGTEGLTGTLTLAKVTAPVTATVASTPDVKIGVSGQALGDVTITESAAGVLDSAVTYAALNSYSDVGETATNLGVNASGPTSGAQLLLVAPSGVNFDSVPTVTVTSGDLQLDTGNITTTTTTDGTNEGELVIPIKGTSTTASTITISGIKVTVDRTVPEGAIPLKVKGTAVNECTFGAVTTTGGAIVIGANDGKLFQNDTTAAKVTSGNVATPAPAETQATAVFKIGDTKFQLNGVDQTMDAAPYIKDDRTYLPIRFVAEAVGVTDSNIIWNSDDQSVTMIKGGTVVKLVVGSNTMTINGTPITMDVAPEIVDPGRVMLPVRWVGQALGANIQWDAATQTVTVN